MCSRVPFQLLPQRLYQHSNRTSKTKISNESFSYKKENIVNKTLLIMSFVRIWRGSCLYQVFFQSQNGIIKSNHALICWSPSHDTIWLPTFKLKTIIFRIRGTFTFISNDLERPQKACLYWAKRFNRKEKKNIHTSDSHDSQIIATLFWNWESLW